jgi:hypothetical protein
MLNRKVLELVGWEEKFFAGHRTSTVAPFYTGFEKVMTGYSINQAFRIMRMRVQILHQQTDYLCGIHSKPQTDTAFKHNTRPSNNRMPIPL